ncbi:Transferase [Corchorus olitorius]|uniref:Transferase n=1 Tax=Corchorus olitorius TaxID=93759 RepID=A0A1R3HNB8_9ROSI|nr:Transferase [Corchorus olitorius]
MAAEVGKKEEIMGKVKITGKSHVKPSKVIGRKECQLVTFDLPYLAFYYNQKLLFYKGGDFEEKVEKLKDGLRVVLEEFYQMAGKLGKDEEGVFRVDYDDDMDGVEVLEATAEGISVEELAADEGTTSLKDLIPFNNILNLEGLHRPLLSVQVTTLLTSSNLF